LLVQTIAAGEGPAETTHPERNEEQTMTTGSKLFWAMLWVIGLPLPLLIVLWMLFGSR
jgi:hypothetical protein